MPDAGQVVGHADGDAHEFGQARQRRDVVVAEGVDAARAHRHDPERLVAPAERYTDRGPDVQPPARFDVDAGIMRGVVGAQDLPGAQAQPRKARIHVDGGADMRRQEPRADDVGDVVSIAEPDQHALGSGDDLHGLVRDPLHQPRRTEQLRNVGTLVHRAPDPVLPAAEAWCGPAVRDNDSLPISVFSGYCLSVARPAPVPVVPRRPVLVVPRRLSSVCVASVLVAVDGRPTPDVTVQQVSACGSGEPAASLRGRPGRR